MTRLAKGMIVLVALVALATLAPPATAFHGCPYDITGTARHGATGLELPVRLEWSGDAEHCGGTEIFTLSIGAVAPPQQIGAPEIPVDVPILHDAFAGDEYLDEVHFEEPCWEVVEPYWAWSEEPDVDFWLDGEQRLDLCTGERVMIYTGWYQDWNLRFD